MRLCQRSKEHGHLKLVSVYFIFFQEIGCSSVLILGGVTHAHERNVGGCSNIVLQYNGNFTIARVSREKPLKWGAEIDNI